MNIIWHSVVLLMLHNKGKNYNILNLLLTISDVPNLGWTINNSNECINDISYQQKEVLKQQIY